MDTSAENLILEAGKSEELRQALALVEDARAPDGSPRYATAACRALARMIVCRTYAKPLLELVHLVLAAGRAQADGRYESFFWSLDRATAAAFRARFQAADGGADAGPETVAVHTADGVFQVSYARMPVLAALLELLITTLGYRPVDDVLGSLMDAKARADRVTGKQAGAAANALSRALYAYLKDHLPAVQAQRRHRAFLEFIASRADGMLRAQAVDDDAVLAYWRAAAGGAGPGDQLADGESEDQIDSKTFTGVFRTALRLVHLLDAARGQRAVAEARPIGIDRAAGEVDPAEDETLLAAAEDAAGDLLAPLDAPPVDAIKFLNGPERDDLADLCLASGTGRRFPLSILRNARFGRGQAKITQALRRGAAGADLDAAIDTMLSDTEDYQALFETIRARADHIDRVLLASLRVLAEVRRPEAADLALLLEPDLALGDFADDTDASVIEDAPSGRPLDDAPDGAEIVSLAARRALDRFLDDLAAEAGTLADLGRRARTALKGLARRGFRPADLTAPPVIDGFARAGRPLAVIRKEAQDFAALDSDGTDWTALFAADRNAFAETFRAIYGAPYA